MSRGFLQRFQSCQLVEQQQAAARAHLEKQRSKFGHEDPSVTNHSTSGARRTGAGETHH
ncbi:MAG TPA: hypothetical protein VLU25_07985 [Acidobacteriota bacterium]|nr:hypothetical protein [Acidobacteriota bacterium]